MWQYMCFHISIKIYNIVGKLQNNKDFSVRYICMYVYYIEETTIVIEKEKKCTLPQYSWWAWWKSIKGKWIDVSTWYDII